MADVQGIANVLDYEYYSTYETVGSNELDGYFRPRDIPIACGTRVPRRPTRTAFGSCSGSSVTAHWNGSGDGLAERLGVRQALVRLGSYNGATGPDARRSQSGNPRRQAPTGPRAHLRRRHHATRYVPCQVAFTQGMSFDGPVVHSGRATAEQGNTVRYRAVVRRRRSTPPGRRRVRRPHRHARTAPTRSSVVAIPGTHRRHARTHRRSRRRSTRPCRPARAPSSGPPGSTCRARIRHRDEPADHHAQLGLLGNPALDRPVVRELRQQGSSTSRRTAPLRAAPPANARPMIPHRAGRSST